MTAAEFVADKGARVRITEAAPFCRMSLGAFYRAIGRGEFRKAGRGYVTPDSIVKWARFGEGGGADEVKHTTSNPTRAGKSRLITGVHAARDGRAASSEGGPS